MNVNDIYGGKYLKAADLQGRAVRVVIAGATLQPLPTGQAKIALSFTKGDKLMLLNKTNASIIAAVHGPSTDAWVGCTIELYAGMTMFNGASVPGLMVRIPADPAAPAQPVMTPQPERSRTWKATCRGEHNRGRCIAGRTSRIPWRSRCMVSEVNTMLRAALGWIRKGCAPLPIIPGTKRPGLDEWEKARITAQQAPTYWNGEPRELGILLGDPSGGLADVDIDNLDALAAAGAVLPTTMVFGRPSNRSSHYFYKSPGIKTKKFSCGKTKVLELRGTGAQTLVPPSLHPTGEHYEYEVRIEPVAIDAQRLTRLVAIAYCAWRIAPAWIEGTRHTAALPLAKVMFEASYQAAEIEALFKGLAAATRADDKALADWIRIVAETPARMRDGRNLTGIPTLIDVFGKEIVDDISRRLGLTTLGKTEHTDEQPDAATEVPPWGPGKRKARSKQRVEIKMQTTQWLWRDRVALGELTILAGPVGEGKTTLAMDLGAHVSNGAAWPDGNGAAPRGKVLIVSAEDRIESTLLPRYLAAGGHPDGVVFFDGIEEVKDGQAKDLWLSLSEHLPELEDLIVRSGDVRLVILDPITAYLHGIDSNSNSDVRGVLSPLTALAGRCGLAILAISHLNKRREGEAIDRVIGSVGFVGVCRAVLFVHPTGDEEGTRAFSCVKNNLGPLGTTLGYRLVQVAVAPEIDAMRVQWSGVIAEDIRDIIGRPRHGEDEASGLTEARSFLAEALQDGPVRSGWLEEYAKQLGIAPRTLDRARSTVGTQARQHEGYWWTKLASQSWDGPEGKSRGWAKSK